MTVNNNAYDSWKKRLIFVGVALATFSVPAFAQDSDEDLEELRPRRAGVRQRNCLRLDNQRRPGRLPTRREPS